MNYLRGAVNAISAPYQYYKDINPSTLTGAIDVIVVRKPTDTGDIELACTPFHVRFGKWQVLRPSEKKVNVSVNGQPIPFNMKIGEAGEAFFVFETEGDVPEELITSPILHATRPEQSMEDVQTDRFGARRREDADEGADVTERAESTEETQEPDFLDLNASTPTPPTTKQEPAKDHLTLSLPGASQSLPSPPHTPLLIPSDVLRQDNVGMDSLSLEIDKATESLVANGHAPEVIYTNDLAIDAAGYHSQSRGRSEQSRAGNEPGSTSQTPSPPSSTSRVRRSTPQGRRKHNLKLSPSVSAPLPVLRATSEPPPDTEVELDPRPSSHLGVSDIPVQEYSWEWGEFPQPSPFTPTFGNGRGAAWSTIGKARGKARLSVLSGGENRMDDGVQTRGRSELDVGGLETIRSHSVPPGLEGSPVTKRRELAKRGHHDPDDVLDHGQRGIRRGSLASASPPRVRRDASPGYGIGGKLTASRGDPTRFAVLIEGRAVTFELCVLEKPDEDDVFDGRDELETARVFDAGKVDFRRFLEDPSIVTTKRLVIRWSGDRYITRRDGSPLMDALSMWRDAALQDGGSEMSSPRDSLSRAPSPTLSDEEDARTEKDASEEEPQTSEVRRSGTEPAPQPTRKPTSSSWVRWWSRSRGNRENKDTGDASVKGDRPPLRSFATDSRSPGVGAVEREVSRAEAELAAPAGAIPASGSMPRGIEGAPGVVALPQTAIEKKYAKTLRLTSDQLKSLNLRHGPNSITFSLTATGAIACTARIFVWDSRDLVVVSDIDGTITKSDGLGHVFAMIGRDWTHSGVAKLYTDITRNGYKIMYLTSRAIGQADSTRDYLRNIKQDDYQLPEGPVIMSPDRLMASLHREVIMRKPEVFKMACLRDVQRLFGEASRNTFYAGFGNRITDAMSYRSVNVPSARIFTIDHTGEVKMELLELAGYKSSYIHMTDLVDQMFPPINRNCAPEFTDFNFWRTPVIEFPLPDLSPPSPALSARSDTSNQSALARLRNFSLVGTRQSNVKLTNLAVPAHGDEHRDSRLRQMSSFERLTSPFSSLGPSSGSSQGGRRRSLSPGSYSSSSMTYLDSGSEGDDDRGEGSGGEKRNRRLRRYSVTSMPGALDDLHLGNNDEEEDGADGAEDRAEGDTDGAYVEDEAEAAEHAFDEDFFATGEMKNVPFL